MPPGPGGARRGGTGARPGNDGGGGALPSPANGGAATPARGGRGHRRGQRRDRPATPARGGNREEGKGGVGGIGPIPPHLHAGVRADSPPSFKPPARCRRKPGTMPPTRRSAATTAERPADGPPDFTAGQDAPPQSDRRGIPAGGGDAPAEVRRVWADRRSSPDLEFP